VNARRRPNLRTNERLRLEFQADAEKQQVDADVGDVVNELPGFDTHCVEDKPGNEESHERR
jgi:hypothetical protein